MDLYVWMTPDGDMRASRGHDPDSIPTSQSGIRVIRIEYEGSEPILFDHHNEEEIGVQY